MAENNVRFNKIIFTNLNLCDILNVKGDTYMKTSKNKIVISVISIAILLLSLTVILLDVLVPLNFWTHPILNFLFSLFLGFGVLALTLGMINKSPWFTFVGAILFGLSAFYALIQYIFWWLSLVIVFAMWSILAITNFMRCGSKTEFAINNEQNYKNYEQRNKEKEKAETTKEPEDLPEIKSFK